MTVTVHGASEVADSLLLTLDLTGIFLIAVGAFFILLIFLKQKKYGKDL